LDDLIALISLNYVANIDEFIRIGWGKTYAIAYSMTESPEKKYLRLWEQPCILFLCVTPALADENPFEQSQKK